MDRDTVYRMQGITNKAKAQLDRIEAVEKALVKMQKKVDAGTVDTVVTFRVFALDDLVAIEWSRFKQMLEEQLVAHKESLNQLGSFVCDKMFEQ